MLDEKKMNPTWKLLAKLIQRNLKTKSFKEYRFESSIIFIFNKGHEKDKHHQWITHQCFDFD